MRILRRIVKFSAAADLAREIRKAITAGDFSESKRLPSERVLSESYGTSRTTIRKAMNILREEGLIYKLGSRGTFIVDVPKEMFSSVRALTGPKQIMDVRYAVEPQICRLAAIHGRPRDIGRISEICDRMERAIASSSMQTELESEFRTVLAHCTGNVLLIWISGNLEEIYRGLKWKASVSDLIAPSDHLTHYRVIANALQNRNGELAAKATQVHLMLLKSQLADRSCRQSIG